MEEQLDFQVVTRHNPARTLPEGEIIFERGDPGDEMFLVKSGEIEIRLGDRLLERVTSGGIFGEMAIVDGGNRSATAITVTAAELVSLDRKQVVFLIGQLPFSALNIMKVMSRRLRLASDTV